MKYKVLSKRTPEDLEHELNMFSAMSGCEIVNVQYSSPATSVQTVAGSKVYVFHNALITYKERYDEL